MLLWAVCQGLCNLFFCSSTQKKNRTWVCNLMCARRSAPNIKCSRKTNEILIKYKLNNTNAGMVWIEAWWSRFSPTDLFKWLYHSLRDPLWRHRHQPTISRIIWTQKGNRHAKESPAFWLTFYNEELFIFNVSKPNRSCLLELSLMKARYTKSEARKYKKCFLIQDEITYQITFLCYACSISVFKHNNPHCCLTQSPRGKNKINYHRFQLPSRPWDFPC